MAKAIWTGHVSFGLVNVPVKLFTATRSHDISFREVNRNTGARVRRKRVDAQTGEEVDYGDIVKGYETNGHFLVVEREELDELAPEASRNIEIHEFVELADIEPIYYERPYYLAPDGPPARKPYLLLVKAMENTGKAALATFVMRTKQYLGAIRARDGVLLLSTMRYADEVVDPAELDVEVMADEVAIADRELDMAEQLIGSLAGEFAPTAYDDTYQRELRELLDRKAAGEEPVPEPIHAEAEPVVIDLMEALERSLKRDPEEVAEDEGGRAELEGMSKEQLYELAQRRDIPGRSSMSKGQLIDALTEAAAADQVKAAG
jgi:DNA end-binding protein Ku